LLQAGDEEKRINKGGLVTGEEMGKGPETSKRELETGKELWGRNVKMVKTGKKKICRHGDPRKNQLRRKGHKEERKWKRLER